MFSQVSIVEQGTIEIDFNRLHEYLKTVEGERVQLKCKVHKLTRSQKQNAYMWGCVLKLISEHTGHSTNELHEIFKHKYIPSKDIEWQGETITIRPSTKLLNTKQFTTYLDNVIIEAGEMGITIPSPDEYLNVNI